MRERVVMEELYMFRIPMERLSIETSTSSQKKLNGQMALCGRVSFFPRQNSSNSAPDGQLVKFVICSIVFLVRRRVAMCEGCNDPRCQFGCLIAESLRKREENPQVKKPPEESWLRRLFRFS